MVKVVGTDREKQLLDITKKLEEFIFGENFQTLFFSVLNNDLIYSSSQKFGLLFEKIFKKSEIDLKDFSIIERVLSDKKFLQNMSENFSGKDFEDILRVYKNTILGLKFSPFTKEFEAENREVVMLKIFQTILEYAKNNIIGNVIKVSEREVDEIIDHGKEKSRVLKPEPNFLSQTELNAILAGPSSIKDDDKDGPKGGEKGVISPVNYSGVPEDEWAQAIAEMQQDGPHVKIFETPVLDEMEREIDLRKLDEACSGLVNISK